MFYLQKRGFMIGVIIMIVFTSGCFFDGSQSFKNAHDSFQTQFSRANNENGEIPKPPEGLFDLVKFSSNIGSMSAFLSCDPGDNQKHPLVIWLYGGFTVSLDEGPWQQPQWENDQTGSAFWRKGILFMFPSCRGGIGNPGYRETLFGEVNDIAAAYEYAKNLPYVDPNRIYLAGHSTGGTLALLTAEYVQGFRSVFAFGPVAAIEFYGRDAMDFDITREKEFDLRSPIYWLNSIKDPTFVIEGANEGNSDSLRLMKDKSKNDKIQFFIVNNANHFTVLAPVTNLLANKILADTGKDCNITLTDEELHASMVPPAFIGEFAYYNEMGSP